ncbi:hypothetical protein [Halorhodospira halophila]|uniref:hypothetical protein n=1 Tax=Halorhodospira halophila TaxID=1053 RepID=UPI00191405CF|nr:hypothetical protein [Halorhodospira halophila]MBK5942749.1 hypothetical protein [Halorhodospira halophila]
MNMDDLREMESGIRLAKDRASGLERGAHRIAQLRRGGDSGKTVAQALLRYHPTEIGAIEEAWNELGPDLLRVAEMRLQARARQERARARQLESQLNCALEAAGEVAGEARRTDEEAAA